MKQDFLFSLLILFFLIIVMPKVMVRVTCEVTDLFFAMSIIIEVMLRSITFFIVKTTKVLVIVGLLIIVPPAGMITYLD